MTSSAIHEKAQPRPSFSESDAARLAFELYGVTGSVNELTSERDQNFLVRAESGEHFVLKIAAAAELRETLEFQNAVMSHLQGRVTSGFIPHARATKSDEKIATAVDEKGAIHFVRLVTYLPALLLAEVNPHTPELLRGLGTLLGEIDKALEGFSHPAMSRDLKWDLQGALWIKDYTEHIQNPARREIVEHFIRQFETRLAPHAHGLRTSVVHNDANDYNVLVTDDGDGNTRVAGIIDFGDMLQPTLRAKSRSRRHTRCSTKLIRSRRRPKSSPVITRSFR